jgi:hypothetical protein
MRVDGLPALVRLSMPRLSADRGWEEGTAQIRAAGWLRTAMPGHAVVYRSNSLINQLQAMEGIGLAVLPCYPADREPGPAPGCARDRRANGRIVDHHHTDLAENGAHPGLHGSDR